MPIAENTVFSPMSKVEKVRFPGWSVKLVRDDGVILTPTTLLQSNSTIFFAVRDQDNVSRSLANFEDGVLSPDLIDTSKNFKFNAGSGFWTFDFPPQTDGWKPGDSPLGFKLIIIPRNSQNFGELSNKTIDTQMAKEGNGGSFKRINLFSDFDTQKDLIKQGKFTVNMPVWNFVADPNPSRLISSGGNVEDPFGLFNGDESIRCGSVVELSIPYEINYKSNRGTDGSQTNSTDQGDTGVVQDFIKPTAGHLNSEIYRWKQADTVQDPPNNIWGDPTAGDCLFGFQGSDRSLGPHTFTPKNFDFI